MNFKKFISGASAFAIAASAFAGLAVTANADEAYSATYTSNWSNIETTTSTLTSETWASFTSAIGFGGSSKMDIGRYNDTNASDITATIENGVLTLSGSMKAERAGLRYLYGSDKSMFMKFDLDYFGTKAWNNTAYSTDDNLGIAIMNSNAYSSGNVSSFVPFNTIGASAGDTVKIAADTTNDIALFYVNNKLTYSTAVTGKMYALMITSKYGNSRDYKFSVSDLSAGTYTAPTSSISKTETNATISVTDGTDEISSAVAGKTVTLSAPVPNAGCENASFTVKDSYNNDVSLTEVESGYTFVMPDNVISITASATPSQSSSETPVYTVPVASQNVISYADYTSSTAATTFDWRFIDSLSTASGAVSVSNFDMYLTEGSSINIMEKYYRVLSSGYNMLSQGTDFTIQPGSVKTTYGGKADQSPTYTAPDLLANKWYRVQITYANESNQISIVITDIDEGREVFSKDVTMRNYNSNGRLFVLNEHVVSVTGTAYLANVKAYNPTVTYSYYADGEQVGDDVTVIQGLTPTAPTVPAKTGYTGKWVVDANDATVYNAEYTATRKAFDFGEQDLATLAGKTLKVTVDGTTKTGTIPEDKIVKGEGAVMLAVIITGIPENAESISAVIE